MTPNVNRTLPDGTLQEMLLEASAKERGSITFIEGPLEETTLTYKELLSRSLLMLGRMQAAGLRPGCEIVFQIDRNESFVVLFWACLLGGYVPVPLTPATGPETLLKLRRVWEQLEDPCLVLSGIKREKLLAELEAELRPGERLRFVEEWMQQSGAGGEGTIAQANPDSTAFIQFSSGSTGDPKGIVLTHRNLLTNLRAIAEAAEATADDVCLNWMPLTHDMGLIGCHLTPMYTGCRQLLMPPALFVLRPMLWMAKASEHRVTVSSSPNFGYSYFAQHWDPDRASEWDLSSLRLIFNGAEPISGPTSRAFMQLLQPFGFRANVLFNVYGLAEASLGVSMPPAGVPGIFRYVHRKKLGIGMKAELLEANGPDAVELADVGRPIRYCELRICGDRDEPMPEGVIGHIQVRGGSVMVRYYTVSATQGAFSADGWLRTGDLGFLLGGRLVVTGRRKDMAVIHGQNVYLFDLERVAEEIPECGAGKSAAAAVADRSSGTESIILFIQSRMKPEAFAPFSEAIGRHVALRLGFEVKAVVPLLHLPRTTSGKIRRFALRERYENGEFQAMIEQIKLKSGRQDESEAEEALDEQELKLAALWESALGVSGIRKDDPFFALGGSSLKAASLAASIERLYEKEVPADLLFRYPTLRDCAAFLKGGVPEKKEPIGLASAADKGEGYPLTPSQLRMYYYQQQDPAGVHAQINVLLPGGGLGGPDRVEEALQALLNWYDSLRLSFAWTNGELVQRDDPHAVLYLDRLDPVPGETREELEAAWEGFIRPFDLARAPLVRAGWVEQRDGEPMLLVSIHHLVADGLSCALLMRGLRDLCEGRLLPERTHRFSEYAIWLKQRLAKGELDKQRDYWHELFHEHPLRLELPTDRPRRVGRRTDKASITLQADADLTGRLRGMASSRGATLFVALLSAYQVWLSCYSGQEEITVGVPASGRSRNVLENVVGCLVATLPIRAYPERNKPFSTFMEEVRISCLDAGANQDYPIDYLVRDLRLKPDPQRNPLYDVVFAYHDLGLESTDILMHSNPLGPCDIAIVAEERADGQGRVISFELQYDPALFERDTIERWAGHWLKLLAQLADDDGHPIGRYDLLGQEEKELLLGLSAAEPLPDLPTTVYEMLAVQTERTPERIALRCGDRTFTYRELDCRARELARRLRREGGGAERVVGVMAKRSPELAVAIIAVLQAGAAYLPIDPAYPEERIRFMLADSGTTLLLTDDAQTAERIGFDGVILALGEALAEDEREKGEAYAAGHLRLAANRDEAAGRLAYILYTSGSTGRPKGVQVEQGNVVSFLRGLLRAVRLDDGLIMLSLTTVSFDIFALELFVPLIQGGTVVLAREEEQNDPREIARLITQYQVDAAQFTPSRLSLAMGEPAFARCLSRLRVLLVGGEALPGPLLEKVRACCDTPIYNLYGPTETTVWSSAARLTSAEDIPIGRPLPGTRFYVLSRSGSLQPYGVPGELGIAGAGVARGYRGRPDLTAEKFVDDPFVEGGRMYRTGDLVQWRRDRQLTYIGRMDRQVKLNGYRLELEEIERCIALREGVEETAALVREDPDGGRQLIAFYKASAPIADMREHVAAMLPDYMVPSRFGWLREMPLTPGGKLDRGALLGLSPSSPSDGGDRREQTGTPTPLEEQILRIWSELLGKPGRLGVDDHFFEWGGHSLFAMQASVRLRDELGLDVPLHELLRRSSARELAAWLEQRGSWNVAAPLLYGRAPATERYPVTPAQRQMFLLQLAAPESTAYHLTGAFRVEGDLSAARLKEALRQLVIRHEPLRTVFQLEHGEVYQLVRELETLELEPEPLAVTDDGIEEAVRRWVRPFRLDQAPLLRMAWRRPEEGHPGVVAFDLHHIAADGAALPVLFRDWLALYEGKVLPPLREQPKEAISRGLPSAEHRRDRGRDYWRRGLAGELPLLSLPTDRPRSLKASYEGDAVYVDSGLPLATRIRSLAQQAGTTPFVVLMTGFQTLLSRYSGQEELIVGMPATEREDAGLAEMAGVMINTLPLRGFPRGDRSFLDQVSETKEAVLAALEHRSVPFEQLAELAGENRETDRNPLFDVMLAMQPPFPGVTMSAVTGLTLTPLRIRPSAAKLDLTLTVSEQENGYRFAFEYKTALFDRCTIDRWSRHWLQLLESATAAPGTRLGELELLTAKERELTLVRFNATEAGFPDDTTLSRWFEEQALHIPDRRAIAWEGGVLSYRELNGWSNQIAHRLRALGVGPDTAVGIMAERGPDMVAGVLGILKAGGAYVPIVPSLPNERIAFMLDDSGAVAIVAGEAYAGVLPSALARVDPNAVSGEPEDNPPPTNGPDSLAYIIYTSGSTGTPKGVMVEHRAVVNRLHWMQKRYPLGPDDRIMLKTSFGFDVSVWELLWWGIAGAEGYLLKPGGERDPEAIARAASEGGVTVLHFVPSMLSAFLDAAASSSPAWRSRLRGLRRVFASGETLSPKLAERFRQLLGEPYGTRLSNLYGPTEAAIDVTYFDCPNEKPIEQVPIGRPIDNIRLRVMTPQGGLQPVGIPGELCIAGVGVARGYRNRPERTAEAFGEDPFPPGGRLYRTGDLARWLPDGSVEYLGRIDRQLKIRGFRIEPGEIEARLLEMSGLRNAIVESYADQQGEPFLTAYYTADRAQKPARLRAWLATVLPGYMIPAAFVHLDRLPVTASGKLDRASLPAPGRVSGRNVPEKQSLTSGRETELAALWRSMLPNLGSIGPEDRFFDLGGHSLLAMRLSDSVRREYGAELPLPVIFENPTLREMAAAIHRPVVEAEAPGILGSAGPREHCPLSPAQKRLYILHELADSGFAYHMPIRFELVGDLERERLQAAFRQLIARHGALRTGFTRRSGEPVQTIREQVDFTVDYAETDEEGLRLRLHRLTQPFELENAPLLRVALLKLTPNRHVLAIDLHHLIADETSLRILTEELGALYNGERLPPVGAAYTDFAVWMDKRAGTDAWLADEAYWLHQYADGLPSLQWHTDYPRKPNRRFEGEGITHRVDDRLCGQLVRLADATRTTLYMLLLAAYQVLLGRYAGQEDVVVGTPVDGRSHAELERTVGMFAGTLALRGTPRSSRTFREHLDDVKQRVVKAFEHRHYPLDRLLERLRVKRQPGRNPLFDTMFALADRHHTALRLKNLSAKWIPPETLSAKFDLSLDAVLDQEGLSFEWEFDRQLFARSSVQRMNAVFLFLLEQLAKDPDCRIGELDIVPDSDKTRLLPAISHSPVDARELTFADHFEAQARLCPDAVAVRDLNESVAYKELNERANRLAHWLRSRGIGAEQAVGIMLGRSIRLVVGVLAVVKAGAAYVPIDPDYPPERIRHMLIDSGAKLVWIEKDGCVQESGHFEQMTFEQAEASSARCSPADPAIARSPGHLAYITYTSGTSGRPKGVMIEHRSWINAAFAWRNAYRLEHMPVRLLQLASVSFDVFAGDLARALLHGGCLTICPNEVKLDPALLLRFIGEHRITLLESTPALIMPLMRHALQQGAENLPLQLLIVGSDAFAVDDYRFLLEAFGSRMRIVNSYGVSEACIDTSLYEAAGPEELDSVAGFVPIGKPLPGMAMYIVNERLKLQPFGVPGELLIGGKGVARGYCGNEELTSKKFIPDAFAGCGMLYRTGDLARMREDGNVEFLGRLDRQVKLRGYRIEPGEIERMLQQDSRISEAVVEVRSSGPSSAPMLCAYYTARDEAVPDGESLRAMLRRSLPEFMIPSRFLRVDRMPLSPNGKIDRGALPNPQGPADAAERTPPVTPLEREAAMIWREALRNDDIGVTDDFFEAGGDSLSAMAVTVQLREVLGRELPLQALFLYPTIRQLLDHAGSQGGTSQVQAVFRKLNASEGEPLFCFPPLGGFAHSFRNVARYLHECQVIGADFVDAADRAAIYAEAMNELQPSGSFRLAAHSAGAHLAYEAAKELELRGRVVSLLLLFDSYVENGPASEAAAMTGIDPRTWPDVEPYLRFLREARIDRPLSANIHWICAEEADPDGWRPWQAAALGEVRHSRGNGSHHDMLREPHVQANAEKMRFILLNENRIDKETTTL